MRGSRNVLSNPRAIVKWKCGRVWLDTMINGDTSHWLMRQMRHFFSNGWQKFHWNSRFFFFMRLSEFSGDEKSRVTRGCNVLNPQTAADHKRRSFFQKDTDKHVSLGKETEKEIANNIVRSLSRWCCMFSHLMH